MPDKPKSKTTLGLNSSAKDAVRRSMQSYAEKVRTRGEESDRKKAAMTDFLDIVLTTLKVFADAISDGKASSAEAQMDPSGTSRCTLTIRKVAERKVEPPPLCSFFVSDDGTAIVSWEQTATGRGSAQPVHLPRSREWVCEEVQAFLAALA